ncbi:MAG: phosphoglycerate kinase [Bacteroidetes bacterium]|nr:phosphoglycerate kinase [Bacteroidota bacterium]
MINTLHDLDLYGSLVLTRVDFNVPMDENGKITDDTRIRESIPTIKYIIDNRGIPVIISHLGRPNGKVNMKYSLAPVAKRLEELMGEPVHFATDCIGAGAEDVVHQRHFGEIALLENLRFHPEEEANDPEFAARIAELGELYINDAFGTCHRAHASTVELANIYVTEKAVGFLLEKELKYLGEALENPERPFVAILGGSKVSGKIDVIRQLLTKCDTILIGGGMMFTFYKAMGLEIGNSLIEEDRVSLAAELIAEAKQLGVTLLLPTDVVVADSFSNDATFKTVSIERIEAGWIGMDIGEKTCEQFNSIITSAKTVVWNGPMGVFEMPNFESGTRSVAKAMVRATEAGAITIIGGGDSAAAIHKFNLEKQVSHVSTGGGASLEFLEGKILPGVKALEVLTRSTYSFSNNLDNE